MKKTTLLLSFVLFTAVTTNAQSYVNPLERWARYNLGELNTFTTGDEDIAIGKFYQFGRNVPLANEGDVLYWSNQAGPYSNGSPANYRVWHIHLINSMETNSNWFDGGTTEDTWESIVAQTVANGAPPAGTFEGYEYTVEGYRGTNGGSPAPKGWHLPTYAEMKSIIAVVGSNDFTYETFTVNDFQETNVDIIGDGNPQNYLSDYKSKDMFTVVARRFKGTPHETAFRYEYQEVDGFNTLEIRAKQSGGATIDEIAAWSSADWSDAVVRYFPVTGFRTSGNVKVNSPTEGYYWTGAVSETDKAYFITFSSKRLRGSSYNRSNAYAIRCVKDYDGATGITTLSPVDGSNVSVRTDGSRLYVSGKMLKGKDIYVYDSTGSVVYKQRMTGDETTLELPVGLYIVKVDGKVVKAVLR